MVSYIDELFDPEEFRKTGHALIDLLANHLEACRNGKQQKVMRYTRPEDELEYWQKYSGKAPLEIWEDVIARSTQSYHPGYMGHQVATTAPLANFAGLVGLHLNNGLAVYEVGPAGNAIEKWLVDKLIPHFGYDHQADGFLTSGGTIGNLTTLLCARSVKAPGVWKNGTKEKYAFMVSEEAHYCIDRAVRIMGWGDEGIIKIPVDQNYKMRTELLPEYLDKAALNGIQVLGVVGSLPTTSTGIHDDLNAIGAFCRLHNLWFHVDGAHGGPAVFSEKYRYLTKGIEFADSIIVDAHKMMINPGVATIVLFKDGGNSFQTFRQEASYLFGKHDADWYNYGKRTMECTKLMMSLRLMTMIQVYGMEMFGQHIDHMYQLGSILAEKVKERPNMELGVEPESNIVCYRIKENDQELANRKNSWIRSKLLEEGDFFIVQTVLRNTVFLRSAIMNPMTTPEVFDRLLDRIEALNSEF
jgi:L-2,4-diaminobutyrate decarboxylase